MKRFRAKYNNLRSCKGASPKRYNIAAFNYFFFFVGFFFAADFFAGLFFGDFFFAAFFFVGFAFFTECVFFAGAGPLLIMGSSQQITPMVGQPHSSSTITESPHTSQLKTSPFFALDICYSSSLSMYFKPVVWNINLKINIFQVKIEYFFLFLNHRRLDFHPWFGMILR
jgi:hypothetical protein